MLTTKLRNQFGPLNLSQPKLQFLQRKENYQYYKSCPGTEEYIALSLSKLSMVGNIRLGIEDLQIIRHKATIV